VGEIVDPFAVARVQPRAVAYKLAVQKLAASHRFAHCGSFAGIVSHRTRSRSSTHLGGGLGIVVAIPCSSALVMTASIARGTMSSDRGPYGLG